MENNKYLDKVIGSLVRSTKIDYENNRIHYPFSAPFSPYSPPLSFFTPRLSFSPFITNYCKNHFGLTDDEIEYVWEDYRSIILDKISKREP